MDAFPQFVLTEMPLFPKRQVFMPGFLMGHEEPERDTLHHAGGEGKKRLLLVSVCMSMHMHKTTLINEGVSGARDVMHKEKQCAGLTPPELHKSVSLLIILLVRYSHREWLFLALISEIYSRETLLLREKTHPGFC